MSQLRVERVNGAVVFWVHVQPRASTLAVTGTHGDALKVRIQAPPVDGSANAQLVELLASTLGASRGDVRIAAGATSRRKRIEVRTTRPAELHDRLRALAATNGGMRNRTD